jgi:hypothetical protein
MGSIEAAPATMPQMLQLEPAPVVMQRITTIAVHAGVEAADFTRPPHLRPGIEQHSVGPGEYRGYGTYSDSQRKDYNSGETGILLQLP